MLRLWSAGCATGEEPYSLALLLADHLGAELAQWNIKIFATDLDENAIEFARRGLYPENVLGNLPPSFKSRYFDRVDPGWRISKGLRQMVIFGQQDISKGVPFPRIDLVVCRNLLIYFNPDLQQRVLDKFAYSLYTTHGYLFLGQAETVRPSQNNFELDNKKWKVYRCLRPPDIASRNQSVHQLIERAPTTQIRTPMAAPRLAGADDSRAHSLDLGNLRRYNELVLRLLPVGVVVVDRSYRIITINTAARRLLGIRDAALDSDFLHAARSLPYSQVRSAIDSCFREHTPSYLQEVKLEEPGGNGRYINVTVVPGESEKEVMELVVLNIQDATDVVETRRHLETIEAEQRTLSQELQTTNQRLSDINKELQDSNEELQATNEELMLAQEELQATNEEFEATNEELQATNEELETNNEELQATNEELQARTAELQELSRTLANERAQLAEIVELAPYSIMVLRGNKLLLESLSPRYGEILGAKKALGTPIDEVLDTPQTSVLLDRIWAAYRFNTTVTIPSLTAQALQRDGQRDERYMTYTIVPIHDKAGEVDGLVVYAEDVTERMAREAEERLSRLRLVVEHADQVALGLYDASTSELLYASPIYREQIARATGHDPDALTGRKWAELAPDPHGEEAAHIFQSVLAMRQPRRLNEVLHRMPDGTDTVWDYTLTPILDSEGDASTQGFIVVSAIEITQQVRVRQQMERLDRMKDLFLSSASHELRTPLVPLVGYAGLLVKAVERHNEDPGWDPTLSEYVRKLARPIAQLRRLVNDLFDVARLESGKLTLDLQPVDLRQVVEQAVQEAALLTDQHPILSEIKEDAPVTLEGDSGRLGQVLGNVLHNAIRHSPDHEPVIVRLYTEAEQAVIEVEDRGTGISAEDLPHIWDRFYQSSRHRGTQDGLGLGLHISRSIIEQHGGTITAASAPGEGSTFTIRLPLQQQTG